MDSVAAAETDSLSIQEKIQAIAQQSEENFNESEISATIGTLEEGLSVLVNEVQGLQNDMDGIEKDTEDLKKRMNECSKLVDDTTEWIQRYYKWYYNFRHIDKSLQYEDGYMFMLWELRTEIQVRHDQI